MNYKEWQGYTFNHPVSDPRWYWQSGFQDTSSDLTKIKMLTSLFQDNASNLKKYTNAQLSQGLWGLIGSGSDLDYAESLFSPKVEWDIKRTCIESIPNFFESVFATLCDKKMSHNDRASENPLNLICYMFWDVIPWGGEDPNNPVYLAYLDELEKIIDIPHVACKESALHGLGHSFGDHPERVASIIEKFVKTYNGHFYPLIEYAKCALVGDIL